MISINSYINDTCGNPMKHPIHYNGTGLSQKVNLT